MGLMSFFHELFRNKVFLTVYIICMIIVAVILGFEYGSSEPVKVICKDSSGYEQPCPTQITGIVPNASISVNWSLPP